MSIFHSRQMEKNYILKAIKNSIIVYSGPKDSLPRFNEDK